MKETTIDQTLVLCDLDSLLLDAAGNLPQLQRDVLQLFASRGGRLTVFSQRSPRAVRSLLGGCGSVRLRWSAAAHWPTTFRRAPAPRCAALRGWRSLS